MHFDYCGIDRSELFPPFLVKFLTAHKRKKKLNSWYFKILSELYQNFVLLAVNYVFSPHGFVQIVQVFSGKLM